MKRIMRYALTALIILCLAGITSLYLVFDSRPDKSDDELAHIVIRDGSSLSSIAQQLYEADIISSPESFKVAAKLLNRTRAIYPGAYSIPKGLTNTEAIEALAHAKAIEVTVTIPEGLRSDEIIGILSRQLNLDSLKMMSLLTDSTLLSIAGDGFTHLEGTLFPETYRFLENSDEFMVMAKMVRHFRESVDPEMLELAAALGFDLQRLITFASLVEKETAREDERRLVSSVYHNRIQKNMLLGCDPTVIYMLVRRGEWNGNLQRKHFAINDPYNSYLKRGLPPGPIANPGLASIHAALNPEKTDFLYFVGKNDGTGAHDFSKTLREHNNKVNRYQRRRSNR
ncbi:MAG: endolytic transglycosylase MltG [Candidatus Marinimicrobia bacterium]|nr:endolytic transglycosylase MltG [Candidatus Neomarinimicrobiota bacterium]MBT3678850.1 endolytic transglycosylase MltG [Candidatus Neomarinimicrobiota bacterium]MBT3949964.1 endolytic transglycosylase MltG [Candidatus Neomarinimicrobiota bacterium]MBT4481967.1 endolytic transglycosylase MltG [Candidatus Neomarinimicrobiota bacterium]MBT5234734.1 endolytic transglycosylase MltG [Candidatus Neomarinimicrobiota bacterium]